MLGPPKIITQIQYILWFCSRVFVESFNSDLRSANGPAQDSLHQIQKLNKRFHRLGRAKLKYMSEIADSKASFEGDLAVKSRKLKMQSTSSENTSTSNI